MAEEHKKFEASFKDGELHLGVDSNKDGEKVIEVKLNLNEAYQEILARGEKIEGAKIVAFEFGLAGLKLVLDTDQDGEKLLELNISLSEVLDEAGLMK